VKLVGRAVAIVLGALLVLYLGDFVSARFGIPGHRQTWGSVQVQTLYAVRQKDNRVEYELGDVITQTCVHSLFPQMGYAPCWYLSEHATKQINVGRLWIHRPSIDSEGNARRAGDAVHCHRNGICAGRQSRGNRHVELTQAG